MGENDIAEILTFLESMETPDLGRVEEFLSARGVSAAKMQAARQMLEQMGLSFDSPNQELQEDGELMSLFGRLTARLDSQTRQQFKDIMERNRQQERLNSSDEVIAYLKSLQRTTGKAGE